MIPIRIARAVLFALLLVGVSAAAAAAQSADPERASRMLQLASEAEEKMREHGPSTAARLEAASFRLASAKARAASDRQVVTDLLTAAKLLGELDPEQAARLLDSAAGYAIGLGDVEAAAHAYVDAATVLGESKQVFSRSEGEKIGGWYHKAGLLAKSPLLTSAQRERILERLNPSTAVTFEP